MKSEYLKNLTQEEKGKMRREGCEQKAAERKAKVDAAIKAGAKVKYIDCRISREEQETQINLSDLQTNEVSIYSTVSTYINKMIDNGYKITEVTYYKADNRLCGIGATTTRNKISLRRAEV